MINKERDRPDQTDSLGKPLSMQEIRIYRLIYRSGSTPIRNEQLYDQVMEDTGSIIKKDVGPYILRIRKKLGEMSIITIKGKGYMSRRAYIEDKFGIED